MMPEIVETKAGPRIAVPRGDGGRILVKPETAVKAECAGTEQPKPAQQAAAETTLPELEPEVDAENGWTTFKFSRGDGFVIRQRVRTEGAE